MTVARISEIDRRTTQSGRANAGLWLLEFERSEPQRPDPLTGWNGSGDTNTQVKLTFRTRDEAVAYAERRNIAYHIVPATPVKLKIQAYSDNFR
ncbi:MAG TPA: NADH dehydrogenase ubiquinone Fe-S protein 4 [Sphingomicrobium sp.]|nr:NADH dehydrogenase ubiquinone Fe-S protein 4 [Sphingomicrobium sp.]